MGPPCERPSPKTSTPTTLTTPNENDIKGGPNGDDHDAKFDPRQSRRFGLESVAAFVVMRTLGKDTPDGRPVQPAGSGTSFPCPRSAVCIIFTNASRPDHPRSDLINVSL